MLGTVVNNTDDYTTTTRVYSRSRARSYRGTRAGNFPDRGVVAVVVVVVKGWPRGTSVSEIPSLRDIRSVHGISEIYGIASLSPPGRRGGGGEGRSTHTVGMKYGDSGNLSERLGNFTFITPESNSGNSDLPDGYYAKSASLLSFQTSNRRAFKRANRMKRFVTLLNMKILQTYRTSIAREEKNSRSSLRAGRSFSETGRYQRKKRTSKIVIIYWIARIARARTPQSDYRVATARPQIILKCGRFFRRNGCRSVCSRRGANLESKDRDRRASTISRDERYTGDTFVSHP